jgi:ArsR family transcriptional regulator
MAKTDPLQSERCARLMSALADPERLRIIQCLRGGPRNVSELADLLSSKIVNVSHHLGVLRHAGLVQDEKKGRCVIYHLHPEIFKATSNSRQIDYLDFGCCRLEIPKKAGSESKQSDGRH